MTLVDGGTTARGYGNEHQKLRQQWQRLVDTGQAFCHAANCLEPSRWIAPHTPWDLGHTIDRTAWTGPEHARCNRSEGGRRARRRPKERTKWKPKRDW